MTAILFLRSASPRAANPAGSLFSLRGWGYLQQSNKDA